MHARRAEMASRAGLEHMRAAACYAEAGAAVSFEAVCLGFLDRGEDDALALYLRRRLDFVDRERDPETAKKLANWLADLHVSRACQGGGRDARGGGGGGGSARVRGGTREVARPGGDEETVGRIRPRGRRRVFRGGFRGLGRVGRAQSAQRRRGESHRDSEQPGGSRGGGVRRGRGALPPRARARRRHVSRRGTDLRSIPRDSRTRSNPVWRRRAATTETTNTTTPPPTIETTEKTPPPPPPSRRNARRFGSFRQP